MHKIDEIRLHVNKFRPDLFFINEAEISQDKIDKIYLNGYTTEVADSITLGKARIVAYTNSAVGFKRMTNLEGKQENIIIFETPKVRIIGLYRGFKNYREVGFDSLGYLFSLLEEGCKSSKKLVVIGDFNVDPTRDSNTPQGRALDTLMINNSLQQLVCGPTRFRVVNRAEITTLEESTLDLILTTEIAPIINEATTSDHNIIGVTLNLMRHKQETKKVTIRDWTGLTPCNVARVISVLSPPNELQDLELTLHHVLEKLAPLRVVRTRLPENIINPKVEKIKKKRDRLYRMYKISQDTHFLKKV